MCEESEEHFTVSRLGSGCPYEPSSCKANKDKAQKGGGAVLWRSPLRKGNDLQGLSKTLPSFHMW